MIDSHCHIDCDSFAADRSEVLARAAGRGVEAVIVPAVGRETWSPILALARSRAPLRVYPALGVHPVVLPEVPAANDERLLADLAAEAAGAQTELVAVGECGLDAAIDLDKAPWSRQEAVLGYQLRLARDLRLPVVLHARGAEAYKRLLALLEDSGKAGERTVAGMIHSYSGGADLLPRFLGLGLYVGFAGPATYPDARKVRASILKTPAARLLAETDAPDQTPAPHRPGRSEPAYVADIIAGIAAARGESAAAIAELTASNARALFGLPR